MTDTPFAPAPRRPKAVPVTWPAFVVAAVIAVGVSTVYTLGRHTIDLEAELGPVIWRIFNTSLLPTVVVALGVWCLLYYGFVRWRNGERGPLYFNTLLGLVFATMMLAPLARHQVQLIQAGDIQGLKVAMERAAAAERADDARARAPLDAALAAAQGDLTLDPSALASAADRREAKARVETARQASKTYHDGYAARRAHHRAAFAQVVASHKVSAEIKNETFPAYDKAYAGRNLRAERDFQNQQALFDEADAGIAALNRSLVEVEGNNLWFSSRSDAAAYGEHRRNAAVYRNRLARMVGASDLEIVGR